MTDLSPKVVHVWVPGTGTLCGLVRFERGTVGEWPAGHKMVVITELPRRHEHVTCETCSRLTAHFSGHRSPFGTPDGVPGNSADPPKVTSDEAPIVTPADPPTVHLLDEGRAICGKRGVPGAWGPGHRWVYLNDAAFANESNKATCPGCIAMRDHPGVFSALVAVAEAAMHWRAQGSLSKWTTIPSRALALEVDAFRQHWAANVCDGASSRYLDPASFDGERKTAVLPASLPGPAGALPELQIECSCGELFAPMTCPRCERRHPPIVMAQRPMVWHAETGTYREVEPEQYTDDPPYKRTVELLRALRVERDRSTINAALAPLRQALDAVLDAFEAEDLEQ